MMETSELKQQLIDWRRVRLGQQTGDVVPLLSNPEFRVALVPLTEAEYIQTMRMAALYPVEDMNNATGAQLIDRLQQHEVLAIAIRNPQNLEERIFEDGNELADYLEIEDVNYLGDLYLEITDAVSPSLDGMTEEELNEAKKVLRILNWSALSGRQWWALKRFLLSISPDQLVVKSRGSSSTSNSTTKRKSQKLSTKLNATENG
jgi:hypothetical protein